jgi:tryptophan synthase alpha chain
MGYLNPVFHYGYERFFARCEQCGISGIIIPDLPYEEKGECEAIAAAHNVDVISMIAPTSESRIRAIASEAKGFLYVVSSMGVTGVRSEIKTDLGSILSAIRKVTDIPAAVGFGINTPEQAAEIAAICDGVIVGSAIVRIAAKYGSKAGPHIYEYVRKMKEAIALI